MKICISWDTFFQLKYCESIVLYRNKLSNEKNDNLFCRYLTLKKKLDDIVQFEPLFIIQCELPPKCMFIKKIDDNSRLQSMNI